MSLTRILDNVTQSIFSQSLEELEQLIDADVLTIVSPIFMGLDNIVKDAIEAIECKRSSLAVILDTGGGVVERMVHTIRHHYQFVSFIIPDRAMSAGTIFVMSGDRILMNYFSVLGPIDPQLEKDGKMIPVLSYLDQYEKLKETSRSGNLTTVEYALIQKLDLAELQWFEQAKELSIDLLKSWLSNYKFKNWINHSSTGKAVTHTEKIERAENIARLLCDNKSWHSHGRGLSKDILSGEQFKLKIDDIADIPNLNEKIDEYFSILRDFMNRNERQIFIHTKGYLL